ncbi:MAG: glycosyltransferase [Bdellovibrionales bacterium]
MNDSHSSTRVKDPIRGTNEDPATAEPTHTHPAVSVCIPARNEERFITGCLESVRQAEAMLGEPVEIVVALNRCTDRTEEIARSFGAKIVREDAKNLSRIRNAAAKAVTAPIVVTIDADSRMSENMLVEVRRRLETGRTIGGGVLLIPERLSLGILLTSFIIIIFLAPFGLSGGLFWCRKVDFEKMGGFNEDLLTGEDVDFAFRLRKLGRQQGRQFSTIFRASITTSCRKFDEFGDWYLFNPVLLWRLFKGRNRHDADRLWYDVKR